MKGRVVRVTNHEKRSGYSEKTKSNWNIMEVEVEKDDGSIVKADSFDLLADGDVVELEPTSYTSPKTGQTYHGFNAKVPKEQKSSGGGNSVEIMQAIRMVFREQKEINRKLDLLIGPPETDAEPPELGIVNSEPDYMGEEEPHNEPLPDEPEDIESFMNG